MTLWYFKERIYRLTLVGLFKLVCMTMTILLFVFQDPDA